MRPLCAQKLARLQAIVAERAAWTDQLAQVKRLHCWLLEVEHLLDESLVPEGEVVSNVTVGSRLDSWREHMAAQLTDGPLSELERECLTEFLHVPRDAQRDFSKRAEKLGAILNGEQVILCHTKRVNHP